MVVIGPRARQRDRADRAQARAVGAAQDLVGRRQRNRVVRRDGSALSEEDVREHVRVNLARFKVPRDVVFVDVLPRNATGKVLKRELRMR